MHSLAQQMRLRQRGSYQMNVYDAASRCLICFALEPDSLTFQKRKEAPSMTLSTVYGY
jgi:hypothetical protein